MGHDSFYFLFALAWVMIVFGWLLFVTLAE
jgi:hypothetical protein